MTAAGRSLMLGAAGLTALAAAALLALTAGGPPEGTAAGAAAGRAVDGAALARGWWAAWLVWAPLSVGAIGWMAAWHVTGGRWGVAALPLFGLLARAAPLVVLTGLPVLAAPEAVFPWLAGPLPETAAHRAAFHDPVWAALRSAAYVLVLAGAGFVLPADPKRRRPGRGAAVAMAYALATTFAAVDWQMSLEPAFASSAFGLRAIAEQMTAAFVLVVLLSAWRGPPMPARDTAALLAGVVMAWGYVAFMEYLVIWSGNLPHKVEYFLHRGTGWWPAAIWVLVLAQLVVPLVALLFTRVRASLGWLAAVAALVLAGRVVDRIWRIVPAFDGATLPPLIATAGFAALLGALGAAGLAVALERPTAGEAGR